MVRCFQANIFQEVQGNRVNNLDNDTKSVLSGSSKLTNGYYRAPRSNYRPRFKIDKKEVKNEEMGRTVTSEYDYSGILT